MRLVCTAVTVVGVAVVVALVVRGMDPFTHDFVFNRRAFDAITWGSEPDENGRVNDMTIDYDESVMEDVRARLGRVRRASHDAFETTDEWAYGMSTSAREWFVRYWATRFSWEDAVAKMNAMGDHGNTVIQGIRLHFVVRVADPQKYPNAAARAPVLFVHGWPGSFFEFHKAAPMVTDPLAHGGVEDDARDVVIASIPGYGYSSPPNTEGFSVLETAALMAKLMARLERVPYVVQGGDWGSIIASFFPVVDPDNCLGLHLNMFSAPVPPHAYLINKLFGSEEDKRRVFPLSGFGKHLLQSSGYLHLQATYPHSVSTALNDSPAGLLEYLLNKFQMWTGVAPNGTLTDHISADEILTNVMIYWTTESIRSSMRYYKECFRTACSKVHVPITDTPVGFADFAHELVQMPTWFLGYKYHNVTRVDSFSTGGHFAAFEVPDLLVASLRGFLRDAGL